MAVISSLSSLIRALIGGVIGLIVGYGVALLVTWVTDRPVPEIAMAISYPFALIGWLMGIGVWKTWAREWVGLTPEQGPIHGWQRFFTFSLDHKVIGIQYLTTFVILFLLAGLMAMLIRYELMAPGIGVLNAGQFNTVMGLHGIIMIAVAVATIMGGFANFLIPLMIGADDVAFPRINALSFWIVPPVAILLILTPLFGGFDAGWTAYPPLSVINANGQVLFLLAFITFGFSSILGGLNFLTTIITLRAPGMTWGRLPIFVWSVFAAAIISLTATQVVAFGLLMVLLDRVSACPSLQQHWVVSRFYMSTSSGSTLTRRSTS